MEDECEVARDKIRRQVPMLKILARLGVSINRRSHSTIIAHFYGI